MHDNIQRRMLTEETLKNIKKDAEAVYSKFPSYFNQFQLAQGFQIKAQDANRLLVTLKAFGFLNEEEGKVRVVLHPDQRTINLNKNIEEMRTAIQTYKEAIREAETARQLTFKEKISL